MSIKAETSFSLKDALFSPDSVAEFAAALVSVDDGFSRSAFEQAVLSRFPELELKARIDCMVTELARFLPDDYPQALDILTAALPPPLDPTLPDDDFGAYIWVVPGEYVARFGCTAEHLPRSLEFLRESTKRFSAESAIRPFLRDFPDATIAFAHQCAEDDNYHVRRLASEGTRPLLPWAPRVRLPATTVIELLDRLHADPTRYVTRSVANSMNDLSKQDPDLVLKTLERWQRAAKQQPAELGWMVRHSLRTLTKKDHVGALTLLGYPAAPEVGVAALSLPERVRVGETLNLSFDLKSMADQKLLVTLRLFFLKNNGRLAPKVFTISKAEFAAGSVNRLSKSVSFRPMTTRVLYPGTHRLEVVVNGQLQCSREFELLG